VILIMTPMTGLSVETNGKLKVLPEEKALWERGASNAGYHYLRCGKTMALIGKAFAEAMVQMMDNPGTAENSRTGRRGRRTPAAQAIPPVRFDPVKQTIEGWTVSVDPQLLEGPHSDIGTKALQMLANHLQRIAILIPEPQLSQMKQLEIWIEYHHPTLGAMQYHPSEAWLKSNGHDPRLARKVHITRAESLLSRQQMLKHPAVILHELAHAYHDQVLSFDEPRIIDAFKKAEQAGIYEKALLYTGETVRHYALSNHKEYFAEGTEAFFYRNDFYPFVRAELKEHDPVLHDLLSDLWEPAK
jgi:dipeptidyl-peptidase-4